MPMVPLPGLGARALESYLRIMVFNNKRDRDIELEREIAQAKKTVAALGVFLGRVRSIPPTLSQI